MKKRLTSWLLAAAMLLGMLPAMALPAAAASGPNVVTDKLTADQELANNTIYLVTEDTTITAANDQNGLKVAPGAKTVLYIASGVKLIVHGGHASSNTVGGKAGILLPQNSMLTVTGGGLLLVTGGDGAKAGDGGNGLVGNGVIAGPGFGGSAGNAGTVPTIKQSPGWVYSDPDVKQSDKNNHTAGALIRFDLGGRSATSNKKDPGYATFCLGPGGAGGGGGAGGRGAAIGTGGTGAAVAEAAVTAASTATTRAGPIIGKKSTTPSITVRGQATGKSVPAARAARAVRTETAAPETAAATAPLAFTTRRTGTFIAASTPTTRAPAAPAAATAQI